MESNQRLAAILLVTAMVTGAGRSTAQGAKAPTVGVLEQVLDNRLQSLKPTGTSERNVLFQTVTAGKPDGGNYPFRVSLLIRDYGAGYPANRYYGETCVAKIIAWDYELSPDQFGGWTVDGRMTPDMSQRTCKPNPSAGVSNQPLAGLTGSPAPTGPISGSGTAATPAARGGPPAAAGAVPIGDYQCWGNGQARPLANFTIRDASHYTGYEGKGGTFTFDAATTRITFKGGSLDGILPAAFYMVYHIPQGRPTVSMRNSSGNEVEYCQKR